MLKKMGVFVFVNKAIERLVCFAVFLLLVTHAPLFSCYGAGTGKNKVRIAPASYFVFGVEQMDAVKKSRRLAGMARDMGTALHALNEIAEDYGIPPALAEIGQYMPIWKSKVKRMQAAKKDRERESAGGKKKKQKRKKRRKNGNNDDAAKEPFMVRARKWREELDEVKKIAKGDYVGVAAAGVLCLSACMLLLTPGASQFVLIGAVGMMTGVTRQNLPNMTMDRPFMIICGLLLFVMLLQSFGGSDDDDDSKAGKKGRRKKGPSMRRPKAESHAGGAAAARDQKHKKQKKKDKKEE